MIVLPPGVFLAVEKNMPKKQFSIFGLKLSIAPQLLFYLILILGFVLRLVNINQSLWLDEAISWQAVSDYNLKDLLRVFLAKDFNPPLYYLVLYFWFKIFPASEIFMRLPSVIFGVLTCFLVYKVYFLAFKDKKGALLTTALLATAPLHIYYSQEARTYSLTTFLVAGAMFFLLKFLKDKKNKFLIFNSIFLILFLYSHYLTFLFLPVQWLGFLTSKISKDKKIRLKFIIVQLINLCFFLLWLPIFLKQLNIGQQIGASSAWGRVLGQTSWKNIVLLPVKFIMGRTNFLNQFIYGLSAVVLVILFIFILIKARKKALIFWSWLLLPPFLGIIISLKIPVLSYFRFLFCLPVLYLLTAKGIMNFKHKKVVFLLSVMLLLINLLFSSRYLFLPRFHRENWQEAIAVLNYKNITYAPVMIMDHVRAPFDYYNQQSTQIIPPSQKELISQKDQVWLIPYTFPMFDPEDKTRIWLQSRGFVRTFEQHFNGVTLEKWQKLLAQN